MSAYFWKLTIFIFAFVTVSCSSKILSNKIETEKNFYINDNDSRVAAEWEPALGTLIVCPLCVPYKLVIELAKDNHLYALVENDSSKNEALSWYTKWGIDPALIQNIYASTRMSHRGGL